MSTYFFFRFRLEKISFPAKKRKFVLVKLCFSINFISDFIPLDPDTQTLMNPDPNESGSDRIRIRIRIHITDKTTDKIKEIAELNQQKHNLFSEIFIFAILALTINR